MFDRLFSKKPAPAPAPAIPPPVVPPPLPAAAEPPPIPVSAPVEAAVASWPDADGIDGDLAEQERLLNLKQWFIPVVGYEGKEQPLLLSDARKGVALLCCSKEADAAALVGNTLAPEGMPRRVIAVPPRLVFDSLALLDKYGVFAVKLDRLFLPLESFAGRYLMLAAPAELSMDHGYSREQLYNAFLRLPMWYLHVTRLAKGTKFHTFEDEGREGFLVFPNVFTAMFISSEMKPPAEILQRKPRQALKTLPRANEGMGGAAAPSHLVFWNRVKVTGDFAQFMLDREEFSAYAEAHDDESVVSRPELPLRLVNNDGTAADGGTHSWRIPRGPIARDRWNELMQRVKAKKSGGDSAEGQIEATRELFSLQCWYGIIRGTPMPPKEIHPFAIEHEGVPSLPVFTSIEMLEHFVANSAPYLKTDGKGIFLTEYRLPNFSQLIGYQSLGLKRLVFNLSAEEGGFFCDIETLPNVFGWHLSQDKQFLT